jgi:hypothetical protein
MELGSHSAKQGGLTLDAEADTQRRVDRPPVEALDDAIHDAFALLERHRREASLLSHSRQAAERYEALYLVAAIDRLERYLHVADELTDFEAIRVWVEELLAENAAEHARHSRRRPFGSRTRRKARERAGARFEAVAAEVTAQLEDALSEPDLEPEQSWRCVAKTRHGARCKNSAIEDGLCELHARLARAATFVPQTAGRP